MRYFLSCRGLTFARLVEQLYDLRLKSRESEKKKKFITEFQTHTISSFLFHNQFTTWFFSLESDNSDSPDTK